MKYDDLYKALADEHRRQIIAALCEQPVVAGDLARRVGLAPNALSFHLKWLRSAGLIGMERRGRHLWYQVHEPTLDAWREHVNHAFRRTLASRAEIAVPDGSLTGQLAAPTPQEADLPSELL